MTKVEYIRELEQLLSGLPEEDKRDAITFYAEYFDEAGVENEKNVVESLGQPSKVAAKIKADAAMKSINEPTPKVKKGVSAVWMVLLGILALPIALPIGIAIVAVIVSVLIAIFAVIASFVIAVVSMMGAGIVSVVGGFVVLFQSVPSGIFYIGLGLASIGLGIILGILVFMLARVTFRGIANIMNRRRLKAERKHNPQYDVAQPSYNNRTNTHSAARPEQHSQHLQPEQRAQPVHHEQQPEKEMQSVQPEATQNSITNEASQPVPSVEQNDRRQNND